MPRNFLLSDIDDLYLDKTDIKSPFLRQSSLPAQMLRSPPKNLKNLRTDFNCLYWNGTSFDEEDEVSDLKLAGGFQKEREKHKGFLRRALAFFIYSGCTFFGG